MKGDILSSEEMMAKWHLANHLIAIGDWEQTSNAGRQTREELMFELILSSSAGSKLLVMVWIKIVISKP